MTAVLPGVPWDDPDPDVPLLPDKTPSVLTARIDASAALAFNLPRGGGH